MTENESLKLKRGDLLIHIDDDQPRYCVIAANRVVVQMKVRGQMSSIYRDTDDMTDFTRTGQDDNLSRALAA